MCVLVAGDRGIIESEEFTQYDFYKLLFASSIQGTSRRLTILCVVMLFGAPNQQRKLILLLQTESKRESQLFGKHIALYDEHLEIPSGKRAAGGGRQRKHASFICVR